MAKLYMQMFGQRLRRDEWGHERNLTVKSSLPIEITTTWFSTCVVTTVYFSLRVFTTAYFSLLVVPATTIFHNPLAKSPTKVYFASLNNNGRVSSGVLDREWWQGGGAQNPYQKKGINCPKEVYVYIEPIVYSPLIVWQKVEICSWDLTSYCDMMSPYWRSTLHLPTHFLRYGGWKINI